jgi:hypothetical protein
MIEILVKHKASGARPPLELCLNKLPLRQYVVLSSDARIVAVVRFDGNHPSVFYVSFQYAFVIAPTIAHTRGVDYAVHSYCCPSINKPLSHI